jgi:hypothetical protein
MTIANHFLVHDFRGIHPTRQLRKAGARRGNHSRIAPFHRPVVLRRIRRQLHAPGQSNSQMEVSHETFANSFDCCGHMLLRSDGGARSCCPAKPACPT